MTDSNNRVINLGVYLNDSEALKAFLRAAEVAGLTIDQYQPGQDNQFEYKVDQGHVGLGLHVGQMEQMDKFWKTKKGLYMSEPELELEKLKLDDRRKLYHRHIER